MRTAHQNAPVPQLSQEVANKDFVDSAIGAIPTEYDVLFKWNHTSTAQFTLTDPLAHGWAMLFVAATATKAEHILVTAPVFGGTSKSYLTVTAPMVAANFEMLSIHNFFNIATQQYVYQLARAANVTTGIYAGARWEQPLGVLTGVYNATAGDQIVAASIEPVPSGPSPEVYIVETHSSVRGHLLGKGWGRLSSYGQIDSTTQPTLMTSQVAGMGFTLTGPASQTIEIYDLVVYQRKP
jgi:hypothetical protein